jgi:hypothetical protein
LNPGTVAVAQRVGDLLLLARPLPVPHGRVEHRLGPTDPTPEQPDAHEHQHVGTAGLG